MNYGAIGAVIGHEITHGYDDQGRQFDADRQLRASGGRREDAKQFEARREARQAVQRLRRARRSQVNGKLTLGENIADLGGLNIAYDAYADVRRGHARTR